jgi:hypothetical protein
MSDHLRYAGLPVAEQREALLAIIRSSTMLMDALQRAEQVALPDCWIVSGAIYNTVWNVLTGRNPLTGIKDIDLFYFDPSDLSYDAEDLVIRQGQEIFAGLPRPVEIRNQARVHLWYEGHFGTPYPPLKSSREGIDRFASKTHAVAASLRPDGEIEIYAPYGLDDLFGFRITPNPLADSRQTHEAKGARALSVWPELKLVPWAVP